MKLLLVLCLFLPGCATLVDTMGRPETLATCALADAATTSYAVSRGFAYENNPLLAPSVNQHNFGKLVLAKAAEVALAWFGYEQLKENYPDAAKYGMAAMSVITCGVSINNATIISGKAFK